MTISTGSRLGPYEILAPIGAGGMGEVWRARDPRLGRDVAIKVLPASFSADADRLRRFEQEARAAGILNHPNITAVLDIGEHESAPYVVQELLEGETLRQVLAGGRLPARRAIDYAIQIAHGLAAAHEKGIVHRDLKPENLFVTKDGRVKILDFGLAKLTHMEEGGSQSTNLPTATAGTEPGVVLGTLGYMSPEQVRGRSADARSDIFSFGAILYEMLAGQRAFKGDSAADTMSAILREDPPDISLTNQNVPPGIERIVRHCLEKTPEQRFQSARDLAFDLESLSGVSTPSRPAALPDEKPSRKRRAAIPLLVTVAALIAAGAYLAGARLRQGSRVDLDYQQLTFKHQPVFNARFAPDGRTLVFSSAPAGNATEIFTWRPDSPGVVSRGMKGVQLLSISSKGELAVLIKTRYLRHRLFEGTLARMPLEGGAPRELADGIREADWAPDGADLAVSRNVGGRDRLEFPMGKVLAETGGYFSDLRFSPDGKRIAFFEHPIRFDDRGSVAVVDLSGRKTTLSDGYWAEEGLAWSADGREVIFSGGLGYNNFSVFAVDLAGRRRTALQSAGGLTILDISGDRWAASRDDFFRDVFVMPPNGDREKDLSWLELSYPVAFTPDGKTMLFTEESPSAGSLYSACIRGTDGSPVVRLGEGNANDLSSDGKWVLSVVPTNPDRLVMYPTGSGSARAIPSGGIVTYESAQFFPGAERVFFCGHESGKGVRCYVQGVGDAKPRAVTAEGTTAGWVSPDGRRLCVQTADGLDVLPAEGGPERKVPGATADDLVVRWHPDGGGLLVARPWDVPLRVERLDLSTGKRTPFRTMGPADLTGAIQILPVAIANDTRVYGYGARRMHSDLFLVKGAH